MGSSDWAKMGLLNGKPLASDTYNPGDAMTPEQKLKLLQQLHAAQKQQIDPRDVDNAAHLDGAQPAPSGDKVDPGVLKTLLALQKPNEDGEIPPMDSASQFMKLRKMVQPDAAAAGEDSDASAPLSDDAKARLLEARKLLGGQGK